MLSSGVPSPSRSPPSSPRYRCLIRCRCRSSRRAALRALLPTIRERHAWIRAEIRGKVRGVFAPALERLAKSVTASRCCVPCLPRVIGASCGGTSEPRSPRRHVRSACSWRSDRGLPRARAGSDRSGVGGASAHLPGWSPRSRCYWANSFRSSSAGNLRFLSGIVWKIEDLWGFRLQQPARPSIDCDSSRPRTPGLLRKDV